jgi:lipid-binding SYLF domain-containing protein
MTLRIIFIALFCVGSLAAQSKVMQRLEESADVLIETMEMKDQGIPQDLLDKAHCVVIIPGMKKGAFVFGGKFGKGFLGCRGKGGKGWTAPGGVVVEGGSFGLQIGGSETDVIMLVMNEKGKAKLLSSKFTIGGDASAAAGPVGRTAAAQTDAKMTAEILTYSRARGVFAGLALDGATLRQDKDTNKELYGRKIDNKEIVTGDVPTPKGAEHLHATLNKYSANEHR